MEWATKAGFIYLLCTLGILFLVITGVSWAVETILSAAGGA